MIGDFDRDQLAADLGRAQADRDTNLVFADGDPASNLRRPEVVAQPRRVGELDGVVALAAATMSRATLRQIVAISRSSSRTPASRV